jgi:acyl carrier protein
MKKSSPNKHAPAGNYVARVQRIVAHQLKKRPNDILPSMELQKDLGADSLDALEIVMNIEEEFKLQIPDDEARKARTVKDIVNYINQSKSKS